jgi:archaellum component FlaG (FlaF/FlaG flagellin family)
VGVGDSVSQTIFFIASVALATAVVVMAAGAVNNLTGDIAANADTTGTRLRSEIRIISDAGNVQNNPLKVLVKNVGAQTLHPSLWTVLYDGTAQTTLSFDVLSSTDDLTLGEAQVVLVTITGLNASNADHTVRVITESGVEDQWMFNP